MQRGFAHILLILVLFVVVAGGAYYIGKNGALTSPVSTPTSSPQLVANTPLPDETKDWKTYTNNKYNFSLKYPSDWKYLEVPNSKYQPGYEGVWFDSVDFPPPGVGARAEITLRFTKSDPSLNWPPDYFNNYKSENYILGNMQARKITGTSKELGNHENIIIAKLKDTYLEISANESSELIKIMDEKIISTFRFD